jgi:hypothetical protein
MTYSFGLPSHYLIYYVATDLHRKSHMKRLLLGITLGSALFIPATLTAQQDHRTEGTKSYYDAAHKDQHEWNDNEAAAWNRYRDEHHVKQSDFARANKRQQQDYWNWRHQHSDQH